MLVFTRKRDEAIVIGDGIEVRVLRVGRDSVKIGVVAAQSVPVHRGEVYEQIMRANRAAAGESSQLRGVVASLRALKPQAPAL